MREYVPHHLIPCRVDMATDDQRMDGWENGSIKSPFCLPATYLSFVCHRLLCSGSSVRGPFSTSRPLHFYFYDRRLTAPDLIL